MTTEAIITISVIGGAVLLFATELLSMDLVALLIMVVLVLSGVITPVEGISGFSNPATLTVAFMFVISAALLQTGAMQAFTHRLSGLFRIRYGLGILAMMVLIGFISAFVNNTPVVAMFIPVIIQLAHAAGQNPSKMLIPLSFASIFGGNCTLIGTSTNIVVSGIAAENGLEGFSMFELAPIGLILALLGIVYLWVLGPVLLPNRNFEPNLEKRFGMGEYMTEIELLEKAGVVGKKIMDSHFVKDLEMDILAVRRGRTLINLPSGDFRLRARDILTVRCDAGKIRQLKDQALVRQPDVRIADDDLTNKNTTLVELVIPTDSEVIGRNLREMDFRHRFRAVPLAIRQRREIRKAHLYEVKLQAGDVVLAEVKTHFVKELKRRESTEQVPFVVLSEDPVQHFDQRKFFWVLGTIIVVVAGAALGIFDLLAGAMAGVAVLAVRGVISMRDAYEAINWKIIFLLAGALSIGVALKKTGLDQQLAGGLIGYLDGYGPAVVLSGLYLLTSILTELMSNTATAALMAPIAIATAQQMDMSPTPFLIAVTISASASFMTPMGYQTNTMVFSAGRYRFVDFLKVGTLLNLLFWVLASLLIPILYF